MALRQPSPAAPTLIHTVTEAAKLAFADREAWYGDPRQSEVPLAALLSAEYAAAAPLARRRHGVGGAAAGRAGRRGAAAAGLRPGGVRSGSLARPAASASRPQRRVGAELGPGDTCHLDVADRFGNLVSATPSGGWLQSSPVIPGLGFCLGTRAQMFTLTPGLASSLAPGRRPRTTLSPGLALRDGEPYLAFGTPGGDQQDQWSLAFFLNHVVYGHEPPGSHRRAGVPHRPLPVLVLPARVGAQVAGDRVQGRGRRRRRTAGRGHDVSVRPPWSLGRMSAVARSGGFLYAAANPRGMQGYAAAGKRS